MAVGDVLAASGSKKTLKLSESVSYGDATALVATVVMGGDHGQITSQLQDAADGDLVNKHRLGLAVLGYFMSTFNT